jgi:predicted DNA-binding protein YlxM (UPF0122 family)
LPALERVVAIIRELNNHQTKSNSVKTCVGCANRDECKEPCDAIKAQLPGIYEGTSSKEIAVEPNNFGFVENETSGINSAQNRHPHFDDLKNTSRITSVDAFDQYEQCWHIFTKKQHKVLIAYYKGGKTITEIANDLNKSIGTVSGLIARANLRKKKHNADLMATKIKLMKTINEEI